MDLECIVGLTTSDWALSIAIVAEMGNSSRKEEEMARWILAVETNCTDPSREKEFNEWYDNIHLQDILQSPGMLSATRYKNSLAGEGRGEYLALYEMETEDMQQTMAAFGEKVTKLNEGGRISELVKVVSMAAYWQITPPVKRK